MKIWIDDQCFEHDDDKLETLLENGHDITEWDDEFDGLEPENFDDIQTVVEFLEEHSSNTVTTAEFKQLYDDTRCAYIEWCKNNRECTYDVDKFHDEYQGRYDYPREFALELATSQGMVSEDCPNYFDADAFWNDLECGGDYYALGDNDQYIFRTM